MFRRRKQLGGPRILLGEFQMLPRTRSRAVRAIELRKLELAACHCELPRCTAKRAIPVGIRQKTSDAIHLPIELNLAPAG